MFHIVPLLKTLLRRKLSVFLIAIQIAIATAIFSNLAFVIQDIVSDYTRPTGFEENQLFTVTLRPIGPSNYTNTQLDLSSMSELTGFESASYMRRNPLGSGRGSGRATIRTTPDLEGAAMPIYKINISDTVLPTLGLSLIQGRDFTPQDMSIEEERNGNGPDVIIISYALAEALFGADKNYIGKTVYEGGIGREIIGVSEDSLGFTMPTDEPAEKTAFYPQYVESETEIRYLVRSKTPAQRAQLIEDVSALIRKNYQNQLFLYIEKIDDIKERMDRGSRLYIYQLLVLIIFLGLVVSFAISGQTLFNVNQRRKQTGIRRALGASQQTIFSEIIYENMLICCIGLSVGIVFSIMTNQALMQQFSTLPVISPMYILVTCLILMIVCILSAAAPAWQAGKISPSLATRTI